MNRSSNDTIEHPAAPDHSMTTAENSPLANQFPLGQTLITPNALSRLHPEDTLYALTRHANRDWGELGEEDRLENDLSLQQGFRLLSAYRDRLGNRFWIITEADRSATTILLPEDY